MADPGNGKGNENDNNNGNEAEHAEDERPLVVDRSWIAKLIRRHGRSRDDDDVDTTVLAVAPMVEQSDLPFRLLCRKYGANTTFTPMIHARYFLAKPSYRRKMFRCDDRYDDDVDVVDRPLFAQLCGNDRDVLLRAARTIVATGRVDAIDLNCGCPTLTAKRGRYGAYLLGSGDHLVGIVRCLARGLAPTPLTVKVRLLSSRNEDDVVDVAASVALCERLVDAGAAGLTVHGRTLFERGENAGPAHHDAVRAVVERIGHRVPVLANGGVGSREDVATLARGTGADGVMSSEAVLEYPPLFACSRAAAPPNTPAGRRRLAEEYLKLAERHPPENGGGGSGIRCLVMHLRVFLHDETTRDVLLGERLNEAETINGLRAILDDVRMVQEERGCDAMTERPSWYLRHRGKRSDADVNVDDR